MASPEGDKDKLNKLRSRFKEELPAKIADIEFCWINVLKNNSKESLHAMYRLVHDLSASGVALKYPQVSELARTIDVALLPVVEGEERIGDELKDVLDDYLKALSDLDLDDDPEVEVESSDQLLGSGYKLRTEDFLVYLLEADREISEDIADQVSHFGYRVEIFHSFIDLFTSLSDDRAPDVLVMSVNIPGVEITPAEAADQIRKISYNDLPVVFLSDNDDIEHRLMAARSGADAYFVKPIDVHEMIDQLDKLTGEEKVDPLHIVIVEDSATQSLYYSSILERAGMETSVINDPLEILTVMEEVSADMILMDMYMPKCSGMELAKVIRQFPAYASIPIVFLSAETQIERQLDAMSLGGDDFLTKPINPPHLIRSVAIRAERARILRTFMITDNLTGLLNHTRIKEQLMHEVSRAGRKKGVMTFAMIDIDHFKNVNDTHGHHVGDRVIKSLARVLQQRLRRSDYIGRYGGEEFAVVLPDADAELATRVLDEIRKNFGGIRQHSPKGDFAVTFSGGIATFPECKDATELALEADKALYVAKERGRNCIVKFSK
ncbi:MAG: diguanylate cyclase [Gammaproteobacteria bacterium]|nr:MAG: diguanylate cyclase [Gammaproteobacteria bacterium]